MAFAQARNAFSDKMVSTYRSMVLLLVTVAAAVEVKAPLRTSAFTV
jgi:hypothetical protein